MSGKIGMCDAFDLNSCITHGDTVESAKGQCSKICITISVNWHCCFSGALKKWGRILLQDKNEVLSDLYMNFCFQLCFL